ncbi:MAG: hypothetical protein HEQ39_20175 [Rhizobacter sp.]
MAKITIKKVVLCVIAIISSIFLYYSVRVIYALNNPSCFVMDQPSKLEDFSKNGQNYFVYHVITGWHDKVITYYLFDKEPIIDECGRIPDQGLLSVHVPEKEIPKKLIIKKDDLELIYMTQKEIEELGPLDDSPTLTVDIEVLGVPAPRP